MVDQYSVEMHAWGSVKRQSDDSTSAVLDSPNMFSLDVEARFEAGCIAENNSILAPNYSPVLLPYSNKKKDSSPFPKDIRVDVSFVGKRKPYGVIRGLLAANHVILNHGQVTWTTPELAPSSPNYPTTPTGGRFSSRQTTTRRVLSGTGLELVTSDEAHFWLNDYVNKQNCRIWSEANPQVYVETPLHPEKLTVWCALWAVGILLQKR
ncbi:hypothetical protein TNCV_3534981 [Trichonephila clavipes]|nr:hypothetical protein TNCV_3534981 [Trichonephila clavipes]